MFKTRNWQSGPSMHQSNFQIVLGKYMVSINMGQGAYGEEKEYNRFDESDIKGFGKMMNTVEVAVMDNDTGNWRTKEIWREVFGEDIYDDVVGWVDPVKYSTLLGYLAQKV